MHADSRGYPQEPEYPSPQHQDDPGYPKEPQTPGHPDEPRTPGHPDEPATSPDQPEAPEPQEPPTVPEPEAPEISADDLGDTSPENATKQFARDHDHGVAIAYRGALRLRRVRLD